MKGDGGERAVNLGHFFVCLRYYIIVFWLPALNIIIHHLFLKRQNYLALG